MNFRLEINCINIETTSYCQYDLIRLWPKVELDFLFSSKSSGLPSSPNGSEWLDLSLYNIQTDWINFAPLNFEQVKLIINWKTSWNKITRIQ